MAETAPETQATEAETTSLPEITSLVAGWVEPPLLVAESRVYQFMAAFRDFLNSVHYSRLQEAEADALGDDNFWPSPSSWRSRYRPYNVQDGVLHVQVNGPIAHRFGEQVGRYLTGDEYIRRAVMRGVEDQQVQGIMLEIDSPGSAVKGIFELTDMVREAGQSKPIRAFVHSALSGAYSLATAAERIQMMPSGHTGSVGVVSTHLDLSKMFARMGVKHNLIISGKYKQEGHPSKAMSEDMRTRWQNESDRVYDKFVSRVAAHRELSEDEVRGTEALVFDADDSLEIGFADSIGMFEEGLTEFAHDVSTSTQATRGFAMSGTKNDDTKTDLTQADVDRAANEARAEARTEERKRWAAVLDSEHYAGREALARQLLDTSDLAAEQVVGAMEKAPKTEAAPAKPAGDKGGTQNHFQEAMDKTGGAGAGTEQPSDEAGTKTPQERANGLFAMAGYAAPPNGATQ